MTQNTTHWYLFSNSRALHNTLLQCDSSILLQPYSLFRYQTQKSEEPQESKEPLILLSLKGKKLPEIGLYQSLLFQGQSPQGSQHSLHTTHSPDESSAESQEPPNPQVFLSFCAAHDEQSRVEGWATLQRQGSTLLSSLRLKAAAQAEPIAWALFYVPSEQIHQCISHHLTLGQHDLRCSPSQNGNHWLLVREPELYLTMKWQSRPDVTIYQSFELNKGLMTPWGFQSPLQEKIQTSTTDSLWVVESSGESQQLEYSQWWQPSEMITLPDTFEAQPLNSQHTPTQVAIPLRFLRCEENTVPNLWMLRGPQGQEVIEEFAVELHPRQRASIEVFATSHPNQNEKLIFLHITGMDDAPLVPRDGIGFAPILNDLSLFVHHRFKVRPTLPASVWQRDLPLSKDCFTLLLPNSEDESSPDIFQCHRSQFIPFEEFVEYQIPSAVQELQELARATVFDVLFQLKPLPEALPTIPMPKPPKREPPPKQKPQRNTKSSQPIRPTTNKECFEHPRSMRVTNPHLQNLEVEINKRSKGNQSAKVSPAEWLELARWYGEEFATSKQEPYWLGEAISCLDQVFNLDRNSEQAVSIEATIIQKALDFQATEPFEKQMEELVRHTAESNKILARLAFRYIARELMKEERSPQELKQMRQAFYRDLFQLDAYLLTQEHRIYVEGVARQLNDEELIARARQRYRERLTQENRILEELPRVVRP